VRIRHSLAGYMSDEPSIFPENSVKAPLMVMIFNPMPELEGDQQRWPVT
jgi:hypothetical protein